MRWVVLSICLAALGCRGNPLAAPTANDAGTIAGGRGAIDAAPPAMAVDASDVDGSADARVQTTTGGGLGTADGGDAGLPLCPAPTAPDGGTQIASDGWSPPTSVPFSCNPLPSAFFFPPPGSDVSGTYARCASFAAPRADALAVGTDGTRAALIGADGVARVVDLASSTVVGVLAPPRATVGLAAFSPSGDTIVTIAPGEQEVTLWRGDTFAPLWTTTLPGVLYQEVFGSGAAFSPDGTTILLSPGDSVYLLDVATGAVRASMSPRGAVLSLGYGWNGQRIAVLSAPVSGMCVYEPRGGTVTILDAKTLAQLATPMTWPMEGDEGPERGGMLVASAADLIVTTGPSDNPEAMQAFRISDGSPLPAPVLRYPTPLALTPDGTAALEAQNGVLELVRLADGTVAATTPSAPPSAFAISPDGSTIVTGSSGASLLGTWRPAAGPLVATCTGDVPSDGAARSALSVDGATVAVDWGTEIRLFRRADGALLSRMSLAPKKASSIQLSPDARYVIGTFYDPAEPGYSTTLFRTSDGMALADLGAAPSSGKLVGFAFSSDGRRLAAASQHPPTGTTVLQLDLETGAWTSGPQSSGYPWVVGLSGDCPLIVDGSTLASACARCQTRTLVTDTQSGVVSFDSTMYLGLGAASEPTSTKLWSIGPQPELVRIYPPRDGAGAETPAAVSAHGERVITGAANLEPCAPGQEYTCRVHDVATDNVIDELPPTFTSASTDLNVLAFGPVLWCAR